MKRDKGRRRREAEDRSGVGVGGRGGRKFRSSRFKVGGGGKAKKKREKKKKRQSGCRWVAGQPGLQGVWVGEVRALSLGRRWEME